MSTLRPVTLHLVQNVLGCHFEVLIELFVLNTSHSSSTQGLMSDTSHNKIIAILHKYENLVII